MRIDRLAFCLLALACLTVAGCNTTEGFGKDLESGGRSIKESAQKHND